MQIITKWAALIAVALPTSTLAAPPSHTPNEAPFIVESGCPFVYASIAGQTGWFVLDTGCDICRLNPETMKSLGVKPDDDGLYDLSNLEVGGAGLKSVKFSNEMPQNFALISSTTGVPIIGILGYNALRMLAFGIDFPAHKAYFWGTKQGALGRDAFFGSTSKLDNEPVLNQDGRPRAAIRLNDRSYFAFLDTGSPMPIVPKSARSWAGNDSSIGKGFPSYMSFGTIPGRYLIVREISIGSNQLDCVPMMEVNTTGIPLVVGASAFAAFHKVFFDLDGGIVSFEASSQEFVGANGLICLVGQKEIGAPGSPSDAYTKAICNTGDPDWRSRMKLVQEAIEPHLPSYEKLPTDTSPPPALKLAWPPENVYFSPFDKGPGVYNFRPKSTVPDKWPLSLVVANKQDEASFNFVGIGGVRAPASMPYQPYPNNIEFAIAPVFDEAHEMAMDDTKDLVVYYRLSPGQPVDYKRNKPVTVDWDDLVDNRGEWTPVPSGPNSITYYPPGMKIPTPPAR